MGHAGKILVITTVLLMLGMSLPSVGGVPLDGADDDRDGSRATLTVRRFVEHRVPVDVNFETSARNATYHMSVPSSSTVTSASVTVQGMERYSLRGTPNDFDDPVGHSHIGYYGQIGRYPPVNSPGNYQNIRIDDRDLDAIRSRDTLTFNTQTPFGANPPNYPYHHFDMVVNTTGMVRLTLDWTGSGYCVGNDTYTHGAEAYLWNYTGREWHRFGAYSANDTTGTQRTFRATLREPWDFTDNFGHINVLVFGQHDEPQGGGWTDPGQVMTDYVAVTVLKNDTLQRPSGPSLSIGGGAPFWSVTGDFTSTVTLAAGSGFQAELQTFINSVPPSPRPTIIPFVFSVDRSTFAELRVTDLVVTVREVDNQPPEFLGAREVAMQEDEDLVKAFDLWDHFDDDYNGPNLTYSVEYSENASAVEAVIHPDGHSVNLMTVAEDWAGSVEFKFNATDVWGLSTVSTAFTVTVQEVNDPPRLIDPGDLFLDEDSAFTLNISAVDPDVQYGDVLTFSDDTDLFDIDPVTGRIEVTPTQADVGKYTVVIAVEDSHGVTDNLQVDITVIDVNDAPVIEDPGVLVVNEDDQLDFNFTVFDEDGDASFSWVLVGGIGTMKLGRYDGRLSWIPSGEHVGITNVSVICTDGQGSADQMNVSIEVVNVNDVPVLDPLPPSQMVEGSLFTYTISFKDPDLEEDPGESHDIILDPPLFPVLPGGAISFTPGNEHVGFHLLTVTVTDADGASDVVEWEVTVTNVNERPTLVLVEEQTWTEGQPVLLRIEASDPDLGDVLTFSDTTSIFDIHPTTGVINFTPLQMNVGKHTLRIVVTDSEGLYDDVYFEVTILPFNDPPTVFIRVVTLKDRLEEGDQLSLAADVDDVDNDIADFTYFWFLDGREVGNEATLTLNDLRPGKHEVEVRVNDGDNDVTTGYEFSVEAIEEGFSWVWVVVVVVLVVVAVLAIKAWNVVQDTGPKKVETPPPEPDEPEPSIYEEDGTFDGWQR